MVGILRAWKVRADEGFANDVLEAVVSVFQIGVS